MIESEIWKKHAEWSQKAFGLDSVRGPVGPLNHLKKEADEAIANLTDVLEFADCMMLIVDAARRAGFPYSVLMQAVERKLEIVADRKFHPPDEEGVIQHVEEG